jgi:hypothetical protein
MMLVGPALFAAAFMAFTLLPGSVQAAPPPTAEQGVGEPVFESESLRIYRVLDSEGRQRLLLTNLDEDGNRLAPEDEEARTVERPEAPPLPAASVRTVESPGTRPEFDPPPAKPVSEEREIYVEAGDDSVVRVDDGRGTTIIININPPPAPEPPAPTEQVIVPVLSAPWVGWGSIVGHYKYPDDHPFLGYSTGVGSPSWLGGLGLNASNGYGLSTAKPCGRGFDCMFPPTTPGP